MLSPIKSYRQTYNEQEFDLRDCKFLGEGHNGIVYRLPDSRIIKIFKDKKNCRKEYMILKAVSGSIYFPKVHSLGGNYVIRDYVSGTCISDYIKKNGLNRTLSLNIMKLLEEFKRLKFTKLDIRCRDIYVQDDLSLVVIDPKACYSRKVDFPRHLSKGLRKLDVLDDFLEVVNSESPKLHDEWVIKLKNAKVI